jgi:hypothetical protein
MEEKWLVQYEDKIGLSRSMHEGDRCMQIFWSEGEEKRLLERHKSTRRLENKSSSPLSFYFLPVPF